jgi:hypothetical protein
VLPGTGERLLPLLLAALPVLAYAPCWSAGRLLGPGDGAALHFPLRAAVWQAYRGGELPSWDPSIFLGTPLLAAYRPGALHPLMLALAALPDAAAFQALVLVSLALAGPLLFCYVRRLGADAASAYCAGLFYALGPYLVGHLDDTATVVAAPLLPALLLAAEHWTSSGRTRPAVATALVLALLLLAGSPEAARAGAALLAGRLIVARLWPGRGPRLSPTSIALVGAGAVLLAAPQLVPALLAAREAGRPLTGLGTSQAGVLPGLTGLILRYASHTPAPALALASVPLLARHLAVRVLGAALAISLALQWGRGPLAAPGALALVFDLALCVLAGLCLSALWRQRRSPRGARLRALFLIACLASAAALSVAAASLGPLPETLQGAVGTLAVALILYFANATSDGLRARLWLLPLTVAFVLQPHGRRVWEDAPEASALLEGSATRQAITRAMQPRAGEPVITLAAEWPGPNADDLAYGNLARMAGRRSVNGYDPMVSLRSRAALGALSVGGVLPAAFFASDPSRLELLGVRWVQVPVAALRGQDRRRELQPVLRLPLAEPRFFPFPMTAARGVRVVSSLVDAAAVPQEQVVATLRVRLASGRGAFSFPLRAGIETAEWAWDRPDVRATVKHQRPAPAESWPVAGAGFSGHHYGAELPLPGPYFVDGVRLEPAPGFRLQLMRLALVETRTGRALPLAPAAVYVSDATRLREAAATPTVRLFELARTIGPARVAAALRVLPDERAVLEALALPGRLGVDPLREALATASDAAGAEAPPAGRASRAELVQRSASRLEVRAEGPGVLVLAESWDAGWQARLDGAPVRLLRVNHCQAGVVLPAGPHRVVLRYRPRGWAFGLALAALGLVGMAAATWRSGSARHSRRLPALGVRG